LPESRCPGSEPTTTDRWCSLQGPAPGSSSRGISWPVPGSDCEAECGLDGGPMGSVPPVARRDPRSTRALPLILREGVRE
jgi:hypothetical protein